MADGPGDRTRALLAEEARQINEYVRALGNALMTWFAMNGTINTLAISWFADRFGSGQAPSLAAVLLIGAFFVAQSLLGIFALRPLGAYMAGAGARLVEIAALQRQDGAIAAPQAAPSLYAHVVRALLLTMVSFAAIWIGLTVLGVRATLAGG